MLLVNPKIKQGVGSSIRYVVVKFFSDLHTTNEDYEVPINSSHRKGRVIKLLDIFLWQVVQY